MKPSNYQIAVYDHIRNSNQNALIDAVAGSGKTTTIVNALSFVESDAACLFVAFNKHIADELKKRVPMNCEVSTLNSLGNRILKATLGYKRLSETKTQDILWFDIFQQSNKSKYYKVRNAVVKLVGLFKAHNIGNPTLDDCRYLDERYEILDHDVEDDEFEVAIATHLAGIKHRYIDFDDQIFLPLQLEETRYPKYDYVFVDETQDLNPAQMELVRHCAGGPIIAVGDTRQAIYGFRGADPEAMQTMASMLKMKHLPLSICYRCAKNVVLEAQKEVAHIEPFDGAPDGIVDTIGADRMLRELKKDDFVLSRTTAPLVQLVLRLISEGRKATIRGRDFGTNLISLLDGFSDDFQDQLEQAEIERTKKLKYKPQLLLMTQDQYETLRVLGATNDWKVQQTINAILSIFDQGGSGIVLSTIHRSKGLEADRVYLIRPDLVPHPSATLEWMQQQEHNLKYIAITRARKEFYYVTRFTAHSLF